MAAAICVGILTGALRHRAAEEGDDGYSAAGLGVRLAHPADPDQPDVNLRHDVPLNVAHRRCR